MHAEVEIMPKKSGSIVGGNGMMLAGVCAYLNVWFLWSGLQIALLYDYGELQTNIIVTDH